MSIEQFRKYAHKPSHVVLRSSVSEPVRAALASNREVLFLLQQGLAIPILNDLLGLTGVIDQALSCDTDSQTRLVMLPIAEEAARELARRTAFWRAASGLRGQTTWEAIVSLLDGQLARGNRHVVLEGIDPQDTLREEWLPAHLLAARLAGTALRKGGTVIIRRETDAMTMFEPVGAMASYRAEVLDALIAGVLPEGIGTVAAIDDDTISLALALRAAAAANRLGISFCADQMRGGGAIRLHHPHALRGTAQGRAACGPGETPPDNAPG